MKGVIENVASKLDFDQIKSDRWNLSVNSRVTRDRAQSPEQLVQMHRGGLIGNKEAPLGQHNKNRVDSRRSFGRETDYFDCGHRQV